MAYLEYMLKCAGVPSGDALTELLGTFQNKPASTLEKTASYSEGISTLGKILEGGNGGDMYKLGKCAALCKFAVAIGKVNINTPFSSAVTKKINTYNAARQPLYDLRNKVTASRQAMDKSVADYNQAMKTNPNNIDQKIIDARNNAEKQYQTDMLAYQTYKQSPDYLKAKKKAVGAMRNIREQYNINRDVRRQGGGVTSDPNTGAPAPDPNVSANPNAGARPQADKALRDFVNSMDEEARTMYYQGMDHFRNAKQYGFSLGGAMQGMGSKLKDFWYGPGAGNVLMRRHQFGSDLEYAQHVQDFVNRRNKPAQIAEGKAQAAKAEKAEQERLRKEDEEKQRKEKKEDQAEQFAHDEKMENMRGDRRERMADSQNKADASKFKSLVLGGGLLATGGVGTAIATRPTAPVMPMYGYAPQPQPMMPPQQQQQ